MLRTWLFASSQWCNEKWASKLGHENNFSGWLVSFLSERITLPRLTESERQKPEFNSTQPFNQNERVRNVMKCAKNHFRISQTHNRKRNMKFLCHKIYTWTLTPLLFFETWNINHHSSFNITFDCRKQEESFLTTRSVDDARKDYFFEILIVKTRAHAISFYYGRKGWKFCEHFNYFLEKCSPSFAQTPHIFFSWQWKIFPWDDLARKRSWVKRRRKGWRK
jgi:hypothetical protein